jgi:hypothetical protein
MPDAATVTRDRPPDNHRPIVETDPLESPSVGRTLPNVTYVTPSAWGGGMTPTARVWARVAVALALMSSLVACSGSNGAAASPPPSKAISKTTPAPSATPSDPQAQTRAAILAVYAAFWRVATAAEAHPRGRHPKLARYAIDRALADEQATLVLYRQQGLVSKGAPKLEPSVVDLVMNGDASTAVIRDCIDISNVQVLNRDGKSVLAPSKSLRHEATAKARMWFGRWVIREIKTDRKRSC